MGSPIVYTSSVPIKHSHYHHCPFCKKHVYETNVICKKEIDHVFYCMNHIQYFRDELGMIDALVDEVVAHDQGAMMQRSRHDVGLVDPIADAALTREDAHAFQHEWTMPEEPTVLYDQYGNAHRVSTPR